MNIVIESKKPEGMFNSFVIPSSIDKMIQIVAEKGSITARLDARSKTRFGLSLQAGEQSIGFNTVPKAFTDNVGGYKYKMHVETKQNWFSGDTVTVAYFVKSKKQSLEQMKDHIVSIVRDYVQPRLPESVQEIKIELIETNAYYTLQG